MEEKANLIIDEMIRTDFSGVVQIHFKGKTVLEMASGYQNRPKKINNNLKTRFGIASGTKLMTALGIMRLVEEKKLSLEDSPFDYIEYEFPTYSDLITIRHLLTHTSGMPDYLDENNVGKFNEFKISIPWSKLKKPNDYFELFPNTKMEFSPGEKFRYNNSAFILLAAVIEALTGSFNDYIKDEILVKADMHHSGFFSFDELPENTANGYMKNDKDEFLTNIDFLPIIGSGDGGMFTCVDDMRSLWDHLSRGKIVSQETFRKMMTPAWEDEYHCYGLGMWLERKDEGYIPFIVGDDPGVSFKSYFDPNLDLEYTIISNTQSGVWPVDKKIQEFLTKYVYDIMMKKG